MKSKLLAVILAFLFGPLGMLYVRQFWWSLVISFLIGLFFVGMVLIFESFGFIQGILGNILVLSYFAYFFIVLPVWAYREAREIEAKYSKPWPDLSFESVENGGED